MGHEADQTADATRADETADAGLEEYREISDLETLKVLADPLRLDLLRAFAEEERTTMQVATELGVPATRLYHHVSLLEGAGLIRQTRSRPVRGTVEKYYRAVARRFGAASGAFAAGRESGVAELALSLLDATRKEAAALSPPPDGAACLPLLGRALIRGTSAEMVSFRNRLEALLRDLEAGEDTETAAEPAEGEGQDRVSFALTVAFLVTDRRRSGGGDGARGRIRRRPASCS